MGLFDRVKNIFKKKEESSTSTNIAPATASVKVTDFSSGESVTTKTETTSGGQTTTTRTASGRGGSSVSPEREQELTQATQDFEAGGTSIYTPPADSPRGETITPSNQGKITPGQNTISAYNYTGEPSERYERPLGSAIGESFKNIFNFGLIGQQGLGAYSEQIFFTPYQYVGKPEAYDKTPMRNIYLENYGGTDFGYGLSEDQKNIYRPDLYKTQTAFEYGETKKRELYNSAGLKYTGEPASLLPTRLGEKVVSDLKPKYENQIKTETQDYFNYYQGKVNSGEYTAKQAQFEFETVANARAGIINSEYQREAQATYTSKIQGFDKKIFQIEQYQSKIFEPPAYSNIRTAGKVVEIGALTGATVFGGSGLTLAASVYIGAKTASQAVQYAGSYSQLTTGQKVAGAASLGVGAASTAFTFNLGVTKFYSEWRGIIYSDLARSPARVTGQEVLKTDELTRFNIASLRQQGTSQSLTMQRVDVYQTGVDRVGFFGKGSTTTRIYDPQYERFITTNQKFTTSGYIPNIREGGLTFGSKAGRITIDSFSSGVGQAKYIVGDKITNARFLAASKDVDNYYSVAGGRSPARAFTSYKEGAQTFTYRATPDSAGKIFKIPSDQGVSNSIITSGKRSSQEFFSQLYSTGGSAGYLTTKQISTLNINTLATKGVSSAVKSSTTSVETVRQVTTQFNISPQSQIQDASYSLASVSLPSLNQILPQRQDTSTALSLGSSSAFALLSEVSQLNFASAASAQSLSSVSAQGLRLRLGNVSPSSPNLPQYLSQAPIQPFRFAFAPNFELSPGGFDLPSSVITGGKRKTGYTPSFSALVFNIRGQYRQPAALRKSGIDFRPIVKGFKFRTGL